MTQDQIATFATLDGNEAVARVAYRLSEVIAIYPITPASPMAEWSDAWAAAKQGNLWGTVPSVIEMQSEAGAAGTVHGALQAGALTTTFTASQGLLLMIPNMYKIAGELTSSVLHVAARSLAAQGLSIFGDHSDVMSVRGTGYALLSAASVQEAQDFAAIATKATLKSRIPFLHFFDGFRTSHEVQKIALIEDHQLATFIPESLILEHRSRALTPDRPVIRGTAQNPDVYFQARETVNQFYEQCPAVVQTAMDELAALTGRQYQLYEYHGAVDAERVIILMGSACETVHETVDALLPQGERVGVLKVRLYRPLDGERLIAALPKTVRKIAVLDRCKEPGSGGEPLYLDFVNCYHEAADAFPEPVQIIGGRYGLSSKEFTPAMVKGIFDHLAEVKLRNHFTIGINDDVTFTSLTYDENFTTESARVVRSIFYGLGSDGTVGANKNAIKIIGEETDNYAQGYFVYDSKKSGSVTVSHLRFGPEPIRSTYLISRANFVACHQWEFVEKFDLLKEAQPEGVFLLNSPYDPATTWQKLPAHLRYEITTKRLKFHVINGSQVARDNGMGRPINTVMQVCFFALAGVLPKEQAIEKIKYAIRKTYGKKGDVIVQMNLRAVDDTLAHLYEVPYQTFESSAAQIPNLEALEASLNSSPVADHAPDFVKTVLGAMMARRGDDLPVSAMPIDGTYPCGTSQWEKRNIAAEIPVWDPDVCVQCGKCVMVCPHSVIRAKVYDTTQLREAPPTFKHTHVRDHELEHNLGTAETGAGTSTVTSDLAFTLQVAAEDCTGCGVCVDICPVKNKQEPRKKAINMAPQLPLRSAERANWDFFNQLPNPNREHLKLTKIGQQQLQQPLFEFSGACGGCGETPYIKLATQLFGDRMLVANATGCSSIYGGNLPTTPWTFNEAGRGPAWANSLFEDNAEFGLGFRVAIDKHAQYAQELLQILAAVPNSPLPAALITEIVDATYTQHDESDIFSQRERIATLKGYLHSWSNQPDLDAGLSSQIKHLQSLADYLVKKSVWMIGGDGWAYDIGFGGLDHVFASGKNVNILVLDTEVYSNTGGQMSKSTPRAAVAKFAAGGKPAPKKDLGLIAMTYGNVYVGSVAMGARDEHTLKVFLEAESFPGPSLIIAYSHCIAHGIDMTTGFQYQKAAVDSGRWLLYRYDPRRTDQGENPLLLDSRAPRVPVEQSMYQENRFKMLTLSNPASAKELVQQAQNDVNTRWQMYQYLAARSLASGDHSANDAFAQAVSQAMSQ